MNSNIFFADLVNTSRRIHIRTVHTIKASQSLMKKRITVLKDIRIKDQNRLQT